MRIVAAALIGRRGGKAQILGDVLRRRLARIGGEALSANRGVVTPIGQTVANNHHAIRSLRTHRAHSGIGEHCGDGDRFQGTGRADCRIGYHFVSLIKIIIYM